MDAQAKFVLGMIVATSRSAVLIIAAVTAALCIYLGWKLYMSAVLSRTSGGAEFKSLKVKLSAASPGIFFVAFGAWLMISVVNRPATIGTGGEPPCAGQNQHSALGSIQFVDTERPKQSPKRKAKQSSEVSKPCAIENFTIVFSDGGPEEGVTGPELRTAIQIAIRDIRGAAQRDGRSSSDSNEQKQRIQSIQLLRQAEEHILLE